MTFEALPYSQSGTMTAAMRAHAPVALELRVAVVREGRITEEKRIARREEVTLGGERATLVTGGPRRTLFAHDGHGGTGFALVGGGLAGRVQQAGHVHDLAQLDDGTRLPLVPGARGRVVVSGVTLLFDFVPARARTRPALPAAVRQGLLGGVDWPFTSWVTAAMLSCFAFVAASEASDPPFTSEVDVQDVIARLVIDPPAPPPPAALVTDPATTHDDAPATPSASHTPSHDGTHTPSRHPSTSHDAPPTLTQDEAIQQATDQAQLLLVTALGRNDGAFHDLMRNGAPTTSQRDVLDQVTSAAVATNGNQVLRSRPGSDSGETHDIGSLVRHDANAAANEGHGPTEQVVHVIVGLERLPESPPEIPQDLADRVTRAVRARIPTIRACYEHHLINAPTAAGKVVEEFTVEPFGGVSHLDAASSTADDGTERCVHDGLATLRITMHPGEGPADFSFPFVFAPQN